MRKEVFIALENGDLHTIQNLHRQESLIAELKSFQGDNALHIAAREGHKEIVRWILRIESLESSLASVQNNDKNTPLHEAARYGDADLVETLLQRNKSCASHSNKFGETPLMIACKYGHKDTVSKLLGAYNYTTETQETNEQGSTSTSETHQSASQTTYRGGETLSLLHAAVQGGSVDIVKEILDHPSASLDGLMRKQDKCGRCAIHVAAMNGRWKIIKEFISKRPDSIDIRSSNHKSVLHFAVQYNQLEVVKNLLKGCKKDSKRREMVSGDHDDSHNTALHLAAKYLVDLQLLDLLLFPGVDVNARNDDGLTALDIAFLAVKDKPDCLQIIRKLKRAGTMHTGRMPNTISNDIINAHMVVASLIATVTFAAIFQIPGGIEDDKKHIQYGAAKMGLSKIFRLFLLSDTTAFITSLSVVVIWLIKRHWQETPLAILIPHELSDISEVNLLISIFWTVVAFIVATIIVVVPSDYSKWKNKDKRASDVYEMLGTVEIMLTLFVPYVVVYFYILPCLLAWSLRKGNRCKGGGLELPQRHLGLLREPGIFGILLLQFFAMTVPIIFCTLL